MLTRRNLINGAISTVSTNILRGSVANRQDIPRSRIPLDVDSFVVCGFLQSGDKGSGAIYVRGVSTGPLAIQDAEGSWWNLAGGPEINAGWFGVLGLADDTLALQAAIDFIAHAYPAGTIRIAAGEYRISKRTGSFKLERSISEEPNSDNTLGYCLALPNYVALKGEHGTNFTGSYVYGRASKDELVCVAFLQEDTVQYCAISEIIFDSYFVGVGAFRPTTSVLCQFTGLAFWNCAIGFYAHGLERCYFDRTEGMRTGCLIAIGGQWATYSSDVNEGGGFSDKTYFGNIHNIFNRPFGESEQNIDKYFDVSIYASRKVKVGMDDRGRPFAKADRFPPYRGICGRVVYLMARHGRPNNANRFGLVSHHFAPRAAVWIEEAWSCVGDLVYLEGCGYRDNMKRLDPIGETCVDPYLGAGVREPAFVRGIDCTIDAQFVHGTTLIENGSRPISEFECNLSSPRRN